MRISDETKEKIKKFAPWVLGGIVVLFVLLRSQSGKGGGRQAGSAPVQDLSALGGGGGAPVMSQPQQVPQDIASQFAQQFQGSQAAWEAMQQQWQQLGNQNGTIAQGNTILGAWKWDPMQELWTGIKGGKSGNIGRTLTENQAQVLGPQNKGPYAQGKTTGQRIGELLGAAGAAYARFSGGGVSAGTPPISPSPMPYSVEQRTMVASASGAQRVRGRTTRPL